MDQLKKLYYDPENGFIGMQKLYKLSKEHNLNLTFKEVKDWYNDQNINQIYKQPPKQKKFNKIIAPYYSIGCFQADLMDMSRFYQQNQGYHYGVCLLNQQISSLKSQRCLPINTLLCLLNAPTMGAPMVMFGTK